MLLVYAVAASMTAPAHAHQMQVAMTTVTFSVRTDSIEVIHRFYTHDTEQAMSQIAGQRVDIMRDEVTQENFGQYVSNNFHLLDQDGKELPLSLVGVELEGDVIWIYQETSLPRHLTKLAVANSALLDLLPKQVNTVNVECGDDISTLSFSRAASSAVATIDFSACL